MCAIIGTLGGVPRKERFISARDTMIHRGPDDAGFYYAPQDRIALGHRRLSIIDLSPRGRQPMQSSDERHIVVFNGEIYNFHELREELAGHYPFQTNTDTEVILAVYARWGISGVGRLRGMFAFALWDRRARVLHVVRDRLGIKPLFYSFTNGGFYFSSEIKGILALSNGIPRLNKDAFVDYLSYRYPLGGKTFFEGIRSLSPGHILSVFSDGTHSDGPYWEVPVVSRKSPHDEQEVLDKTEALLKETVRLHMRSDVSLGAYLSGGVDSSLLVAFMAEFSHEPVKTFSVGFRESEANEFAFARMVAARYGTDHREVLLSENDYLSLLPEVIRFKDAPLAIPNEVPLHVLSRELKKYITVVLSGEGADELFGGYGKIFRSGYDWERIRAFRGGSQEDTLVAFAGRIREEVGSFENMSEVAHFTGQYSYIPPQDKAFILSPDLFNLSRSALLNERFFETLLHESRALSPSEQYMYIFEKAHLVGPLERLDTTTMSRSVEARVPYVDHRVVEYVSALPLEFKLRWRGREEELRARRLPAKHISETLDVPKYLLRRLGVKYLPEEVVHRKKLAFPVPLNRWAEEGGLVRLARDMLSSDARSAPLYRPDGLLEWLSSSAPVSERRGLHLWMLVNFEMWMQEYKVVV